MSNTNDTPITPPPTKQPTFIVELMTATAKMPYKAHHDDAGFDIYNDQEATIPVGESVIISTGIRIRFDRGYWGRLTGRSSTFHKRRLLVVEGIIDEGYTGELFICVRNMSTEDVFVAKGDRLAQLIPHKTLPVTLKEGKIQEDTLRGASGFGSSGE